MIKGALLPQTDYSGGLNAGSNPLQIKDNETPDCVNVHTNVFASVEKRRGKTKLNSVTVGASKKGNASIDYAISPSNRKLCTIWDDTLYKMDDLDGTYDAITMTVAIGSGRAELRQFVGKLVIASHVSGNVQYWDGSSGSTSTITGAAAFKYIWADDVTGRLWAAGLPNFDGVAYYTDVNSLVFDTTNNKIQVSNIDQILGFRSLKGRLFAVGRLGWYRIDDLGGTPRFGSRLITQPGTNSPESAQVADILGTGEGIIYLDTDKKLRFFTGNDTAVLSYKFDHRATTSQAHTLDRLVGSRFDEVTAVVYPNRDWYMLYYSEGSDSLNNNALVYDLTSKSAWPFVNVQGNTVCVAEDANRAVKLYQSGETGYTWQADSGNDDDGTSINSYYDLSRKPSSEQQGKGLQHKWRQVALALKALGEYTLSAQVRMDFSTGWAEIQNVSLRGTGSTLGSFVLGVDTLGGVEAVLETIGIDRLGKYMQLRLQDNSANPAWQLFADEVTVKALGVY